MNQGNFEIFQSSDGNVRLTVTFDKEKETVWLSQKQMSELFNKDVRTVNEHIQNIYSDHEVVANSTNRKFRIVQKEGSREVTRYVDHYNLDVVISVGYRVKSQRGVQFRQWATQLLRKHLIDGYTINAQRLGERGINFEHALDLLTRTLKNQELVDGCGAEVVRILSEYARSWTLIQAYDEQSLESVSGIQQSMRALQLDAVLNAIIELKKELISKGEASSLFGQIRGGGLYSAIATIEQSFDGNLLYPNVASRAAHLIYFVIKNHPFTDGNKRTGSFLFLWYLRLNETFLAKPVSELVNDNTLVALALLVAESKPEQKELIIRLVENIITLNVISEKSDP